MEALYVGRWNYDLRSARNALLLERPAQSGISYHGPIYRLTEGFVIHHQPLIEHPRRGFCTGPVFPFGFEMGFFAVESETSKLNDPGESYCCMDAM